MIKKPKNWWLSGGFKGHKTIILAGFLAALVACSDLKRFPCWDIHRSSDMCAADQEEMHLVSLWKSRWDVV